MSRNQNHGQNPLPSCMEHFSEIYGTVQTTILHEYSQNPVDPSYAIEWRNLSRF